MGKYLAKRLGQTLVIMLIVSLLSFLLVAIMPKDPVYALLGSDITEEEYWAKYYELELDQPLPLRYLKWLGGVVTGDLGTSYKYYMPVVQVMGERLAITIYYSVIATLISFPLGILLGIITAVKRGSWADSIITLLANLTSGVPQFVIALVLLFIFSIRLNILPANGFCWPWEDFGRHIQLSIMPLICLSLSGMAGVCRQTRSSMLEAIRQDYVRTARSKGLKEGIIIYRHVMKNGLIPIITMIGNRLAMMIGGAMFVENVFGIPGMGSLMVNSINSMDIPIIQANCLLMALVISVAYIVTDVLYAAVDPRISMG